MADNEELHPAVQLLLKRMESHPEEFVPPPEMAWTPSRWQHVLEVVVDHGSAADKEAVDNKIRALQMERLHQWALDELLNGEERRKAKLEEEVRTRTTMQAQIAQAQIAQAQ